jgi:hypothetical protein
MCATGCLSELCKPGMTPGGHEVAFVRQGGLVATLARRASRSDGWDPGCVYSRRQSVDWVDKACRVVDLIIVHVVCYA